MSIVTLTLAGRSTNSGIDTRDTRLQYDTVTNNITGTNTGQWGTVTSTNSVQKGPAGRPVVITTFGGTTRIGNKTFKIVKNENAVVCLVLDPPNGRWWVAR